MERGRTSLDRLPQAVAVQDIAAHGFDPDPAQGLDIRAAAHNRAHVMAPLTQALDDMPADDAGGAENRDLHHPGSRAGSAPICLMSVARS